MSLVFILTMPRIALSVFIGVSDEERAKPQLITLSIAIYFLKTPSSCESDDIEDALCYDRLSKLITEYYNNQSFNLIEKMAYSIHNFIIDTVRKSMSDEHIKINIKISKNIALPHLETPVEFEIKEMT